MQLRHVIRRLVRSPLFTLITVATLALGIGANTAIFSVIEGVLLKPLPYAQPDQLIGVWHSAAAINLPELNMSPSMYFAYREQNQTFQGIGLWDTGTVSVTGIAQPEEVAVLNVTSETLPLLGVRPVLGRWFSAADDAAEAPRTAILTYGYWQSKFGGQASVLGHNLIVDGRAREIVGVMPREFHFLDSKVELITPMNFDRAKVTLGNFSYQGLARLKPGVTMEQASADVRRLIPISLRMFPAPPGFDPKIFESAHMAPNLRPLKTDLVGDIGNTLWTLMGTIGLVLLIACANVANLLLVRAGSREHELAIRTALGAGRGEIARELMLESLLLGLLGGAAGVGLAYAGIKLLVAMAPAHLPRLDQIAIDGPVLLFTLLISLAAGALFGAIPVFQLSSAKLVGSIRGGGRSLTQSRERHRARNILVVAQMAIALVLLTGSGLMIRSFQALREVDPGFRDPAHVQTFRISLPEALIKNPAEATHAFQNISDKISAIPGVTSVALNSVIPMDNSGWHDLLFAQDHVYAEAQLPPIRAFHFISPGLPAAMGNQLVAGRDFTWTDAYDRRPVVIVSENLARELWGSPAAALGKRVREASKSAWREVVGVARDERDDGVTAKAPTTVYFPLLLNHFETGEGDFLNRSLAFVVRTPRAGTEGLMEEARRAVWSVNANLPLASVRTLGDLYDKSMARTAFTLVMLGIAGSMALLLGMVGIYGVMSYAVTQRTREIGIRMALGAQQASVPGMFLKESLVLASFGIGTGLAAALGLTRLISSLLFQVKAADPLTLVCASAALLAAAVAASCIPALRASRIDPIVALRGD